MNEREAFERWWKEYGIVLDHGMGYSLHDTSLRAWQARADLSTEPAPHEPLGVTEGTATHAGAAPLPDDVREMVKTLRGEYGGCMVLGEWGSKAADLLEQQARRIAELEKPDELMDGCQCIGVHAHQYGVCVTCNKPVCNWKDAHHTAVEEIEKWKHAYDKKYTYALKLNARIAVLNEEAEAANNAYQIACNEIRKLEAAPRVPEGYALVPLEPTKEMLWAMHMEIDFERNEQNTYDMEHESQRGGTGTGTTVAQDMRDAYAAALAAAPHNEDEGR